MNKYCQECGRKVTPGYALCQRCCNPRKMSANSKRYAGLKVTRWLNGK